MKKFLLLATLLYATSCSNPEDKAATDNDSTSFNSNENNNLNTQPGTMDPGSQSNVETTDTSAAPALQKENVNSTTGGTNRGYNPRDSGR